MNDIKPAAGHEDKTAPGVRRWIRREVMGVVTIILLLFISSGRLDWAMGWLLILLYAATSATQAFILIPRNPELLAERAARFHEDTKPWDQLLLPVYGLASVATIIVAGLDMRLGRGSIIPFFLQLVGFFAVLAGNALVTWSMVVNGSFTLSVRIRPDRGQMVVDRGPYAVIRHPGYAGAIFISLGTALMLGSLWSLIPAVIAIATLVTRTAFEDRALHSELPGYAGYAKRTRFRLLPRVW